MKQLNESEISSLEATFGRLDQIGANWYDVCGKKPCLNFISNMKHFVVEEKRRKFVGYFRNSFLDCPIYRLLWLKYRGKVDLDKFFHLQ